MKLPVWHSFGGRKIAGLAVTALRNEAHAMTALNRFDEARQLRREADRMERRLLALNPIPYRAAPIEVIVEAPEVTAWVADYQSGAGHASPM